MTPSLTVFWPQVPSCRCSRETVTKGEEEAQSRSEGEEEESKEGEEAQAEESEFSLICILEPRLLLLNVATYCFLTSTLQCQQAVDCLSNKLPLEVPQLLALLALTLNSQCLLGPETLQARTLHTRSARRKVLVLCMSDAEGSLMRTGNAKQRRKRY